MSAWEDFGRVGVVTVHINREEREVRMTKSDWEAQLSDDTSIELGILLDQALTEIRDERNNRERIN